ncbi:MAG TPA: LapA family protein [Acidimicrobiales bacterium]|nr:LapA family protein [Acidimicrobiales bacterium]
MARKPVHRDPLTEHVAEDDEKGLERRRRATLIGVAIAGALLGWFALANLRDVRIDFWFYNRQAPLILVIVISGLLGALITALVMRRKAKDKVGE